MIGLLCHDAGVAMRVNYSSHGSSADPQDAPAMLKTVFHYASAGTANTYHSIDCLVYDIRP